MSRLGNPDKSLGTLLQESGLINKEQLQEALQVQAETGESFREVLVSLGFVSDKEILKVLKGQLGIEYISLADHKIEPQVLSLIPEKLVHRHKVVPVRIMGNKLQVAMSDPLNIVAIDDLRLATGLEIEPVLAKERDLQAVINQLYGGAGFEQMFQSLPAGHEVLEQETINLDAEELATKEAPIVRLAHSLILQAIQLGASDLHIEHSEEDLRVRYRIDGYLRETARYPRQLSSPLVSRLKIMAAMDIAKKRIPQDGRMQIRVKGRSIDLRVATIPTVFGEKMVIRILDKNTAVMSILELGFTDESLHRIQKILKHPYGMVLVTGPTGSGKTSTLYAILRELSIAELNVITLEDPVEYLLTGINQVPVHPRAGLTFSKGLRAILRQDPDIIMVGEIRDRETADIAIRAASTGHLVLSTLHTNEAVDCLMRLKEMGVEPFLVASSVIGVIAQRLVRVLCPDCRQKTTLIPGTPKRYLLGLDPKEEVPIYERNGCKLCDYQGFRGRTLITELLEVTPAIRELINGGASSDRLKEQALKEGMVPMSLDGLVKVQQGHTTIEEVLRVTYKDRG